MHVDGYKAFYSRKERRREDGIALTVSESAKKSMFEFIPKNKRVLNARFASSQSKLTIIVSSAKYGQ